MSALFSIEQIKLAVLDVLSEKTYDADSFVMYFNGMKLLVGKLVTMAAEEEKKPPVKPVRKTAPPCSRNIYRVRIEAEKAGLREAARGPQVRHDNQYDSREVWRRADGHGCNGHDPGSEAPARKMAEAGGDPRREGGAQ